jgi:hypothetical protein
MAKETKYSIAKQYGIDWGRKKESEVVANLPIGYKLIKEVLQKFYLVLLRYKP